MQLEMRKQIINAIIGFGVLGVLTCGYALLESPLLDFLSKHPTEKSPLILLRLIYSIHLLLFVGLYVLALKFLAYRKASKIKTYPTGVQYYGDNDHLELDVVRKWLHKHNIKPQPNTEMDVYLDEE